MKQKNPKLMIALGVGGVILFTGFVYGFFHTGGSSANSNTQSNNPNAVQAFDLESGDTNTEVLNTVVAQQKSLEASNAALASKNQQLEQQAAQGDTTQMDAIKGSLADQLASIKNNLQSEIDAQHNSLANPNNPSNSGYAINGSSNPSFDNVTPGGVIGTIQDISGAFVAPAVPGSTNSVAAIYAAANTQNQTTTAPNLPSDTQAQSQLQPMYNIPDGATIGSIYMMTATLAEVPVSGRLIAPAWPFKAIVGRQDLMGTNSQMLPSQIAGAIIQGHAVGNMGLGCANLYVDKITYTFNDGHFWVYPSDSTQSSNSNNGTQVYPSNELGYLALPDGTQCINGLYLTDAPKVLLNLTALGAAANAGNVMANDQISTVSNGMTGQTGTNITGSVGKLFGWSALAGGSNAALNYYQQRVADVFDAIFLPASTNHEPTKLIFNVQQTIPIEYDPNSAMDVSKTSLSSNTNNLD